MLCPLDALQIDAFLDHLPQRTDGHRQKEQWHAGQVYYDRIIDGINWPHLPQSGDMVDTFFCCVVHLFFCGEPANAKSAKYKEAKKGWQNMWSTTLRLDSAENVCLVAESFQYQQSYGSWGEEKRQLMNNSTMVHLAVAVRSWIIRLVLYGGSRTISEIRVSVNSAHI